MIVYMLLNLRTEMAYVGSTQSSLKERFEHHWQQSSKVGRRGGGCEIHAAMRASYKWDWLAVELERYDTVREMFEGEREWILECGTLNLGVGYNAQVPRERDILAREGRVVEEPPPLRRCVPEDLLRERRSEAGRRGARVMWERERARLASGGLPKERTNLGWWDSLTEEQRAAHRARGREAGKENARRRAVSEARTLPSEAKSVPSDPTSSREPRLYKCGRCGERGHNARTCVDRRSSP